MALGRLAKRELPGKRESGPKARPINDQPGADSRHSRGYSLQPSDVAWHLRSAGEGNETKKGREREREREREGGGQGGREKMRY